MVKVLFWIGLGLFAVWVIKASGIIVAASLFLIAGIIPGTPWSLPPIPMLVVLTLALFLVLYWVKKQKLSRQIKDLKAKHQSQAQSTKQKRLHSTSRPRARYSQPKAATR